LNKEKKMEQTKMEQGERNYRKKRGGNNNNNYKRNQNREKVQQEYQNSNSSQENYSNNTNSKPRFSRPRGSSKKVNSGHNHQVHTNQRKEEVEENEIPQNVSNNLTEIRKEEGNEECFICYQPIQFCALGQCNHRGVCSYCAVRSRKLFKENKCSICKTPLQVIILVKPSELKNFENFALGSLESRDNIYFSSKEAAEHYAQIDKLSDSTCMICDSPCKNLYDLKQHLKSTHGLSFCKICLEDRKVFLQEQKLYDQNQLKKHMSQGDGDTSIKHENCQFCNISFYDNDHLYQHLNDKHETCFLCERQRIYYQYYQDYKSLEVHFKKEHFLCDYPECLEKKFVVFATKEERNIHNIKEHTGKNLSQSARKNASKIQVDFTIRSNTYDSQKEEHEEEEEKKLTGDKEIDFPTLQTDQGPSQPSPLRTPLTSNWGAPPKISKEQEFPALSTTSSRSSSHSGSNWGPSLSTKEPTISSVIPTSNWNSNNTSQFDLNEELFPSLPSKPVQNTSLNTNNGSKSNLWVSEKTPDFLLRNYPNQQKKKNKRNLVFRF